MAFQVSPGVQVLERDVSLYIPQVSTTAGAFVGHFIWGPCEQFTTIDSEKTLYNTYSGPTTNTDSNQQYKFWFVASNFLAYGNNLQVNRIADLASRNSVALGSSVLIKNLAQYNGENGYSAPSYANQEYVAKYPGSIGNTLKISVCDYNAYQFNVTVSSLTATGATVASLARPVPAGSWLQVVANSITYNFQTTADAALSATTLVFTNNTGATLATSTSATMLWEFWAAVSSRPSNTRYALAINNFSSSATIYDELHVVIVDENGLFTGTPNTVLEKFEGLSKATDALTTQGLSAYYANYINTNSNYIWWATHTQLVSSSAGNTLTWGSTVSSATTGFQLLSQVQSRSLVNGVDVTPTDALLQTEYAKLANVEQYDVSLLPVIGVSANNQTASFVSDNVSDIRRDCMTFASPTAQSLITGAAVVTDRTTYFNKDTSYAVMDSGWKYQYDRYNDQYHWIPLCGDTAGLCVNTDTVADPWYSPAGYNRGQVKNLVKLNWSPSQTDRDNLYRYQINPVVTQPGLGTLLFGDKTITQKPSAFDRINVRRLFIVLEKAIATAAKFQLFEFNDAFTRSQFVSLVEPFLRNVQGRRGIVDFQVVCDTTNNTPYIIDTNQFVGDIYIKPAKSINFITLNFIATPSGVTFSEVGV